MRTTSTSRGIEHIGGDGQERQEQLLLSAKQAAKAMGISQRTLHTLQSDGVLPSIKVGRRRLYSRQALVQWIAQQNEGGADNA